MNILNICNNADILSILRIVKIVIVIIRVSVPIVLILSLMIGYLKAVKNNDSDALNKVNKTANSKIIAAILIFAIPTFINVIADIVDVDKNSYISCIKIATLENINNALYDAAKIKIDQAFKTLSDGDYQAAVKATNKIKDKTLKNTLVKRLSDLSEFMKLKNDIISLKNNFDRAKYKEVYEKVEKITNANIKKILTDMLSEVAVGKPLNIKTGFFERYSGPMTYSLVVPPNPTTNMPLVVFLHGDGGYVTNGGTTYIVNSGKLYDKEEFFYIAPTHNSYRKGMKWNVPAVLDYVKDIIDNVCAEFECDKDRIIVEGYSFGAIGAWNMVSRFPNFFSACIPVSCGSTMFNANNFKKTRVWAFSGDTGDETIYGPRMRSLVNRINGAGGHAKYTQIKGADHDKMCGKLWEVEVMNWGLEQVKGK